MALSETQRYVSTCDLPFTFRFFHASYFPPRLRYVCSVCFYPKLITPPTSLKFPCIVINNSVFSHCCCLFSKIFSPAITVTYSPVKQMIRLFNAPIAVCTSNLLLLHLRCLVSFPHTVRLCFASSVTLSSSLPFFPVCFSCFALICLSFFALLGGGSCCQIKASNPGFVLLHLLCADEAATSFKRAQLAPYMAALCTMSLLKV